MVVVATTEGPLKEEKMRTKIEIEEA